VKRSPELAPLSRDHHIALERALRLRRATEADVAAATSAFLDFFRTDGQRHFEQEEDLLLPELPSEDAPLGRRVHTDHSAIRELAAVLAAEPDVTSARKLGEMLTAHVRFEERQLFPRLEAVLSDERLAELGAQLG
jgi:hemerythrin-like domain-containing protein